MESDRDVWTIYGNHAGGEDSMRGWERGKGRQEGWRVKNGMEDRKSKT